MERKIKKIKPSKSVKSNKTDELDEKKQLESIRTIIGGKIKEIRKKTGLTQELFSRASGIEPSSLSSIETGKSFPSLNTVLKIMQVFSITPQEFFDSELIDENAILDEKICTLAKNLTVQNKHIVYKIICSLIESS